MGALNKTISYLSQDSPCSVLVWSNTRSKPPVNASQVLPGLAKHVAKTNHGQSMYRTLCAPIYRTHGRTLTRFPRNPTHCPSHDLCLPEIFADDIILNKQREKYYVVTNAEIQLSSNSRAAYALGLIFHEGSGKIAIFAKTRIFINVSIITNQKYAVSSSHY